MTSKPSRAWCAIASAAAATIGCSGGRAGLQPADAGNCAQADCGADAGSPSGATCGGDASFAFCETFEQGPASTPGRAGDLDPARWSAARLSPQEIASPGKANPAPAGPVPACRSSLQATSVYPDHDTLICDPTGTRSRQLLTAAVMHNYGINSYRIRQPFDFAGRTGLIVFDVDAVMASGLAAWVSVEITEDPVGTVSYSEFERGPLPKNGVEIQLNNDQCLLGGRSAISVGMVNVYRDYQLTNATPVYPASWMSPDCVATHQGNLNHFEIQLSQNRIDVYGSDASTDDGKTFPNFHKIASATYDLSFTRGWVHMTAHNHATLKYSYGADWVYRWDNIGFDGPVVANWREYEIPDAMTSSPPDVNTGYTVGDGTGSAPKGLSTCCDSNGNRTPLSHLTFDGVELANAAGATLAFSGYYLTGWPGETTDLTQLDLQYRWNGGTWRDRFLTAGEAASLSLLYQMGNLSQTIDVPLTDLKQGTNTLELLTVNVPQSYPTVVANVDLVIRTK